MSQDDLVVANATFPATRADINSNLQALGSLMSGASAPATTYPYMWWSDTTNGVLKQRNSADTAWVIRSTLSDTRVLTKTSAYTVTIGDFDKLILCSASGGAFAINLPAAATAGIGFRITLKKTDSSTNKVTIDANASETIDGALTLTMDNQYDSWELVSDGSNWSICNNSLFTMTRPEVTLASATTTDLGSASSNVIAISGTTTITGLGSSASLTNPVYFVRFTGALTLTHNATSLIIPGAASKTTANGDTMLAQYLGSGNWKILSYTAVAGVASTVQQLSGKLAFTSTTVLTFSPKKGNQLTINGGNYTIPSSGVTLSNTGLTANTLYYVYAYISGGSITLEASTTAFVVDTNSGLEIKTGDATRTYVGKTYTGAGTPGVFQAAPLTLSRLNPSLIKRSTNFSTVRNTSSTTFVEIDSEIRNSFLCHSDDPVYWWVIQACTNDSGTTNTSTGIGFNGTTPESETATITEAAGTAASHSSFSSFVAPGVLGASVQYATLLGRVNASTARWPYTDTNSSTATRIIIGVLG